LHSPTKLRHRPGSIAYKSVFSVLALSMVW
jgi:hypothetical protein